MLCGAFCPPGTREGAQSCWVSSIVSATEVTNSLESERLPRGSLTFRGTVSVVPDSRSLAFRSSVRVAIDVSYSIYVLYIEHKSSIVVRDNTRELPESS